jgi:hypothetical protein
LFQAEGGDDEQDGVCTHGASFVDLIGIYHEILAQHGDVTGGTGGDQVVCAALEIIHIGQYR